MMKCFLVFTILIVISFVGAEEAEIPQEILDCLSGNKPTYVDYYICTTNYMLGGDSYRNSDQAKECTKMDFKEMLELCKPKFDALNSAQARKLEPIFEDRVNDEIELPSEAVDCLNEIKPPTFKFLQCLSNYDKGPKTTDVKEECEKPSLDMNEQMKLCMPKIIRTLNYLEYKKFQSIFDGWEAEFENQ